MCTSCLKVSIWFTKFKSTEVDKSLQNINLPPKFKLLFMLPQYADKIDFQIVYTKI